MGPDPRGIYFDSRYFGEPSYEYVCWLDVMGTANQMLRSLPISANFVFKLHCAVLEAAEEVDAQRAGIMVVPRYGWCVHHVPTTQSYAKPAETGLVSGGAHLPERGETFSPVSRARSHRVRTHVSRCYA